MTAQTIKLSSAKTMKQQMRCSLILLLMEANAYVRDLEPFKDQEGTIAQKEYNRHLKTSQRIRTFLHGDKEVSE